MASYNRVVLVGNVTREIDLRSAAGKPVCDIGLAVNDRRKGGDGNWIDETVFVDCTAWGQTAENAARYLGKGSSVLIEGRLKLDTWEKDGRKNSKLKVTVDRLQFLDKPQAAPASNAGPAIQKNTGKFQTTDEDCPF